MCSLFGIMDYNQSLSNRQLNYILNVLATSCEARGTDATGIAYNNNGKLSIYKRPVAAHKLHIRVPEGVTTVMGHTRLTTQGSEKMNYNNHPFYGNAGKPFALAHNGVIYNDEVIRMSEDLPNTRIKTDSYIAVQLIEQKGNLSFDSLRYMAEKLEGNFTITLMDNTDNLWIVKGDNPMCLYHYPKAGIYIYASTEEILQSALKKLRFSLGKPEEIPVVCGEIMKISRSGKRTVEHFNSDNLYCGYGFYPYHFRRRSASHAVPENDTAMSADECAYIDDLKTVAYCFGYSNDFIDLLISEGYTTDEIEEILYCG